MGMARMNMGRTRTQGIRARIEAIRATIVTIEQLFVFEYVFCPPRKLMAVKTGPQTLL